MALDAAQIRLCSPPAACSSCYGQYPQRRHVDFGASWDGPVLNDGSDERFIIRASLDELILCEDCLRRGAEQLGLVDPDEQTAMLETQRDALQRMAEENAGLRAHNDALAKAVQSKPASPSRGSQRG
jgi:hypothetical protein